MSAAALRSDPSAAAETGALQSVRASGGISIRFKTSGSGAPTRLADLHEWGGFRAKLPRTHGLPEAVLINTGGGLLGGDHATFAVTLDAGAAAQVTTQAAERIYRTLGPDCRFDIALTVGPAARLHWLPQETILFNQARLARTLTAHMEADSTMLVVEATVFGRAAMAETVTSGHWRDVWRIWRGGQLVFADSIAFTGDLQAQLARPACGAGASAMATVLYVAPDAADRLDNVRTVLAGRVPTGGRAAVTAWNGLLVARLLAPSAEVLKADVAVLARALSGYALPRVWGVL